MDKAFLISIPHSGENIPEEVYWLKGLNEVTLMRDVDRFVDKLYEPTISEHGFTHILTPWHRYFADLNRTPEDIDQDSVLGAPLPAGTHTTGLHWVRTTLGETLMEKPIPMELHQNIVQKYFKPFHQSILQHYEDFKTQGHTEIFHIDAHSMPSAGTQAHRDPGEQRAEIVISDQDGQSCSDSFKDLVIHSYKQAGFQVAYNWPYKGGRLTQTYGQPHLGQQVIQVEINRKLYMDENTKKWLANKASKVQEQLKVAVTNIYSEL